MPGRKRLLFCSWYAFDPATWAVLERLVRQHGFNASVIAPHKVYVGKVYTPSGYLTPDLIDTSIADLHLLPLLDPKAPTNGFEQQPLHKVLASLSPDAVWIYCEPTDGMTRQLLKYFYFRPRVKITCFLAENLWQRPPLSQLVKTRILCHRINGLLACGSLSSQSAYSVFIPKHVKSYTLFMPNFDPRKVPYGTFRLSKQLGDFWVGFAGKISWEKGWHVLVEALSLLPAYVRAAIAGDGPDVGRLKELLTSRGIAERALLAGPLAPSDVRALYRQVDVVVVPSISTPRWKEQFGRVIAEAMAAGRPVIASRSGAIPEVVAEAGLLVEEGDPEALAAAIQALAQDEDLKEHLGVVARRRFESEFSVDIYARRLANILCE